MHTQLPYLMVQKEAQVTNRAVTSAMQNKQYFPSCLPADKQSVMPPKHLVIITLLSTGLLPFFAMQRNYLKGWLLFLDAALEIEQVVSEP